MLLNRHNLNIASLASKEESRFTLQGIHVTPDYTAETDGHQLVKVSTVKTAADTFPQIPGMEPAVDTWKPFILPSGEALNIAKALPKKSNIPVLLNAAVSGETDVNGHSVIGVTDLEFARAFRTKKPEGHFPDIDRVIPSKEKTEFQICLNAALLGNVLTQIQRFKSDVRDPACTFSFTSANSPVRIDATGGEEQELTAVVMPMREKEELANPVYKRRKKAEELLDRFTDACAKTKADADRLYLASELFLSGIILLGKPQPEDEPALEPPANLRSEAEEMHRILVAIWNGLEDADTPAALRVVEAELANIQAVLERVHPPETDKPEAAPVAEPVAEPVAIPEPVAEPEPAAAPAAPVSVLDAIIADAEPVVEPPAASCDNRPTEPPAVEPAAPEVSQTVEPAAPRTVEENRAAVRAAFFHKKALAEAPKPKPAPKPATGSAAKPAAGPFSCPKCGATSPNRQGTVAHLRIVHKVTDKAERDRLMA